MDVVESLWSTDQLISPQTFLEKLCEKLDLYSQIQVMYIVA